MQIYAVSRCQQELELLQAVWSVAETVRTELAEWTAERWTKVDTEQLREDTARHGALIERLPREVLSWDVVIGLHEDVCAVQVSFTVMVFNFSPR
jgi:hypothetical protein